MEYTVQKLANLAGITARTLRYYDEIGILKPKKSNAAGYRIYGQAQVDLLQQILIYRELGVNLDTIKALLTASDFDRLAALSEHRQKLLDRRRQLDELIANVEKTIATAEGRTTMTDEEKFAGFKRELLAENERQYGREIRAKYGREVVERSYKAFGDMSQEQYARFQRLGESVLETLKEAIATGEPAGELAQKTADLHRRWLSMAWGSYSKEAHAGLAKMYVEDRHFAAYYDKVHPGGAEFLRDAILIYTGEN